MILKLGTDQLTTISSAAGITRRTYPVIIAGRSADSTGAESVVSLAIHSILVMFIRSGIGMFVLL